MEGVPRMPMLDIDIKQNCLDYSSLDWSGMPSDDYHETIHQQTTEALKKHVRDEYGEDPEKFNDNIDKLIAIQSQAYKAILSPDFEGCNALKKYYGQLHYMQTRFPFTGENSMKVTFSWQDAFTGIQTVHESFTFEQSAILFNIGAVHSVLGAADSRVSEEGIRISCVHFQCAAGLFSFISDNFDTTMSPDISQFMLKLFTNLMLAQGQECLLEKSMQDNRKNSIVSKISQQVVEFYKQCVQSLDNRESENALGSAFKTWKKVTQFKVQYYTAITQYFMGNHALDQDKYGQSISYLGAGVGNITDLTKAVKNLPKEMKARVDSAVKFTSDVLNGKYNSAVKDNNFIYHDKVPDVATLPEVKGASLVKALPFDPANESLTGPDIFSALVPMEAHLAASSYSEEKAKLLRSIVQKIDEKDFTLKQYKESIDLDPSKLINPAEEWKLTVELVEKCALFNSDQTPITDLKQQIDMLTDVFGELDSVLGDIMALVEKEESEDLKMKEEAGKEAFSVQEDVEGIKKELSVYKELHEKAGQMNEDLQTACRIHVQNMKVVASGIDAVKEDLRLKDMSEMMTEEERNDIEVIHKLCSKVSEMEQQRKNLLQQLRQQMEGDDVTSAIVTKHGVDQEDLFQEELKKYDSLIDTIDKNLAAQDNILEAVTEANARYTKIRKVIDSEKERVDQRSKNLVLSCSIAAEVSSRCNEGKKFFGEILSKAKDLFERAKEFCDENQEKRKKVYKKLEAKSQPPPRPSAPKPKLSMVKKPIGELQPSTGPLFSQDVLAKMMAEDDDELLNDPEFLQFLQNQSDLNLASSSAGTYVQSVGSRIPRRPSSRNTQNDLETPGTPRSLDHISMRTAAMRHDLWRNVNQQLPTYSMSPVDSRLLPQSSDSGTQRQQIHSNENVPQMYQTNFVAPQLQTNTQAALRLPHHESSSSKFILPDVKMYNASQESQFSQHIQHSDSRPTTIPNESPSSFSVTIPPSIQPPQLTSPNPPFPCNPATHLQNLSGCGIPQQNANFIVRPDQYQPSAGYQHPNIKRAHDYNSTLASSQKVSEPQDSITQAQQPNFSQGHAIPQSPHSASPSAIHSQGPPAPGSASSLSHVENSMPGGMYSSQRQIPINPYSVPTSLHSTTIQSHPNAPLQQHNMPVANVSHASHSSVSPRVPIAHSNQFVIPNPNVVTQPNKYPMGLTEQTANKYTSNIPENKAPTAYQSPPQVYQSASLTANFMRDTGTPNAGRMHPFQLAEAQWPTIPPASVPQFNAVANENWYVTHHPMHQQVPEKIDHEYISAREEFYESPQRFSNPVSYPPVRLQHPANHSAEPLARQPATNVDPSHRMQRVAGPQQPAYLESTQSAQEITPAGVQLNKPESLVEQKAEYAYSRLPNPVVHAVESSITSLSWRSSAQHISMNHSLNQSLPQASGQKMSQQYRYSQPVNSNQGQPLPQRNVAMPLNYQSGVPQELSAPVIMNTNLPRFQASQQLSPQCVSFPLSYHQNSRPDMQLIQQQPAVIPVQTAIMQPPRPSLRSIASPNIQQNQDSSSPGSQNPYMFQSQPRLGMTTSLPSNENSPKHTTKETATLSKELGILMPTPASSTVIVPTTAHSNSDLAGLVLQSKSEPSSYADELLLTGPEQSLIAAKDTPQALLIPTKADEDNTVVQAIEGLPYMDEADLMKFKIEVSNFKTKVANLLIRPNNVDLTDLDKEWKELSDTQEKDSRQLSTAIARCSSFKNRYQDIVPFDQSRVILKQAKDDYINASFIDGVSSHCPRFIATQSPLPNTASDFWSMVYEQNVNVIVMLVNNKDVPKRCPIYWPVERSVPQCHGPLTVSITTSKTYGDLYIERTFTIKHKKQSLALSITQLQYITWPEHRLQSSASNILSFVNVVQSYHSSQRNLQWPVVVHCDNGVARTGVFCAFYASINEMNAGMGISNVVHTIMKMRQKRKFMVQEKAQLKFVYDVTLYHAIDILKQRNVTFNEEDRSVSTSQTLPNPVISDSASLDIFSKQSTLSSIQATVEKMTINQGHAPQFPETPCIDVCNDKLPGKDADEQEPGATAPETSSSITSNISDLIEGTIGIPKATTDPIVSTNHPDIIESCSTGSKFKNVPVPSALINLLTPESFTLTTECDKKQPRITKDDFTKNLPRLQTKKDPSDPFSELDPLWGLRE